ncbi:MAG: molybdopterin guanine dinucleotide synthesis B family protein [Pseudomonadota bacterium]
MITSDVARLARAKRAFTTRRVPADEIFTLLDQAALDQRFLVRSFRPGDLALARVEEVGHHTRIERCDGRRARLFPGDEVIVALGSRYAPDQFEAVVPEQLGPCHLAAAGGIAGVVRVVHDRIIKPTELRLIGLIASAKGRVLNLADYAMAPIPAAPDLPAVAVVGTAMNAGKTTSAAALIRGLAAAGRRVGAAKVTGTGAGGDVWHYRDAGAAEVLDFTDAGHVATYQLPQAELVEIVNTLIAGLAEAGCDVAVVEIADGICQTETAALLESPAMGRLTPRVLFAAREAAGAAFGAGALRARGYDVAGVTGLITRAPLAVQEFEALGNGRCLTLDDLSDPATAVDLLPAAEPLLEIAS